MEEEKDGYVGEFVGAEQMRKDVNWFKGTHFKLGGDTSNRMISQSHLQFRAPQRIVSAPNKYDSKSMTSTHFLLGQEKNLGVTTANASYQAPPASFLPSILDEKTKADLRKSHFNLGGDEGRYMTTNRVDYVPKQGTGTERNDQQERKQKMR